MLVFSTNARPVAIRKMPPGPGSGAMMKPAMISSTPKANIDHSTIGLSRNSRHCLRVIMAVHLVIGRGSRKALAVMVHSGLALVRRARGSFDQRCVFGG